MGDGIDHRLEHGVHGKLRGLDAVGCFHGKDSTVPLDKLAGVANLHIQRAGDVLGIQLPGRVAFSTAVTYCLDEGACQERLRLVRSHQHAADRGAQGAVFVPGDELHLLQKFQVGPGRDDRAEPVVQFGVEIRDRCAGNDLFVEADESGLAALLKQPRQHLRLHFAPRTADAAEIAVGALVDKQAAGHVNTQDGPLDALFIGDTQFADDAVQGRIDRVVTDGTQPAFNDVQFVQRDTADLPGRVVNPQDNDTGGGVRHGRQFVGHAIAVRADHLAALQFHAFQFKNRVLAQGDVLEQVTNILVHH